MKQKEQFCRDRLAQAQCLVVKAGTRVLVNRRGRPDIRRLKALVKQIAELHRAGKQVIFVSSGAVGTGVEALGMKTRPKKLPDLQMAAAVGQVRLMARYEALFAEEKLKIAQVLVTHEDLKNRTRHLNIRNTLLNLLEHNIVPILNENDAVSVDSLKIGDNDVLASLVSLLIGADLMVLLSTTDGLRAPSSGGRSKRVNYLPSVTTETLSLASGKGSDLSTGGMSTKLQAAQSVVKAGGLVVIADGRKSDTLRKLMQGKPVGTVIGGQGSKEDQIRKGKKRWLAFFHRTKGVVVIDDGARQAVELRGRSLLPAGVREVKGEFAIGELISVVGLDGELIARGLVQYSSEQVRQIKGRKTNEIEQVLGEKVHDEIIHRDNLVVMSHKETL